MPGKKHNKKPPIMDEIVYNRRFVIDNTWYGGGERAPLYNRLCMNRGYAIFAVVRYFVHTQ